MREIVRLICQIAIMIIATVSIFVPDAIPGQGAKKTQTLRSPFSLAITTEEPTLKTGASLWVDVAMENTSDHSLSVYRAISGDMDQGGWVYIVAVRDEKGANAIRTKFGRQAQGSETPGEYTEPYTMVRSGGYLPLPPHKTIKDRLNIGKLYDVSRPGKYTIQIRRFDEESKTFVKSNTITVTVTP